MFFPDTRGEASSLSSTLMMMLLIFSEFKRGGLMTQTKALPKAREYGSRTHSPSLIVAGD
jgi:hypothetical protein